MEKVSVKTMLGYLPDELLDDLSLVHNVDKQVKKLEGKIVFKLLLYGVLSSTQLSLNVLIGFFDKLGFRSLLGLDEAFTTKRNSLADRLMAIDNSYFQAIFEQSIKLLGKHLPTTEVNGYNIHLFDSTVVSCSAKLLNFGMQSGRKSKKEQTHQHNQIKFTVGFNGSIAEKVAFYDKPTHIADDVPLKEVIESMALSKKDIAVFDRGLKSRKTFEGFTQQNIRFVSRINVTKRIKVIKELPLEKDIKTDSITIIADQIVRLYDENSRQTKTEFRLITAHKNENTQEQIMFITNSLDDVTALEITQIYRLRWEIEKFFKFIKQNLNFSHLISRNYVAIKNMAYVMLIAAMFIALFNKLNKRTGFKISKLAFMYELEIELVKELVIRCNGDPILLNQFLPKRFGQ